jgi:hypothetical protein
MADICRKSNVVEGALPFLVKATALGIAYRLSESLLLMSFIRILPSFQHLSFQCCLRSSLHLVLALLRPPLASSAMPLLPLCTLDTSKKTLVITYANGVRDMP